MTLARRVWFCWFQGLEQAPEVVRVCYKSWVRHNPDWEIVALDEKNAGEYVDRESGWADERLPVQKRANLLRLALLERYGGVWADATCFCTVSLDNWIHDCLPSGFFAFREDGGKRILANWLLAALPENTLIREFRTVHTAYWMENRFRNPLSPGVRAVTGSMERLLSVITRWRDFWFSPGVCKILRIHPYFAFHYHVAWLLRRNETCRHIFESVPFRDATAVLAPGRLIRKKAAIESIRRSVMADPQPLYKLNWKHAFFQENAARNIEMIFSDPETPGGSAG